MTDDVTAKIPELTEQSSAIQIPVTPRVTPRHGIEVCPHCGHPMVHDEVARGLPKVSRRVYEVIRDAGAPGISSRQLRQKVYADDPFGGPESNSASVLISTQINPRIASYGLRIVANGGPGSVFKLVKIEP